MGIRSVKITYDDGGGSTTYTITKGTVTNGDISFTSPASAGATVNIAGTPTSDAYYLSSVTVTPASGTAPTATISGNNASFEMPASNVTVSAVFSAKPTYAVTVSGTGASPTASPASAYAGQTVTIDPDIPSGKVIDWTNTSLTNISQSDLTDDGNGNYTFTMPAQAVTIAFAYKDPPTGGTLTYTPTTQTGHTTITGTVSGTAPSDITVSGAWSGNVSQKDSKGMQLTQTYNTLTLTVSGFTSAYKLTGITVNYATNGSSGAGTISAEIGSTSVATDYSVTSSGGTTLRDAVMTVTETSFDENNNLVITITASTNSVYVNSISIDYERNVVVPKYTVTATASPANSGTFTYDPATANTAGVSTGDLVEVTAVPATGYQWTSWSNLTGSPADSDLSDNPAVIEMGSANVTLQGNFSLVNYAINRVFQYEGTTYDADNSTNRGWIGNWSNNCTVPSVSGNYYSVTSTYGQSVSFTVGTQEGYQILPANITIKDASDNTITPTGTSTDSNTGYVTVTFTMPASAVTITANFTEYVPTQIYMLGTANGHSWNANEGVVMNYDATTQTYSAEVYFAGNASDGAYGRFNFANKLGDNANDWNNMGTRYGSGAGENQTWWDITESGTYQFDTDIVLYAGSQKEYRVPAGFYTVTVNRNRTTVKVVPHEITLTFSPADGADIETGDDITISSNLATLLTNAGVSDPSVTLSYSTDGSSWTSGSTFDGFTTAGSHTLYGKAVFSDNLQVSDDATYTVTAANNSNEYELVTSIGASDIGKKFIIVYESDPIALPNTTNSNNAIKLGTALSSVTGHVTTLATGHSVGIFQLGEGSANGTYTLKYTNATGSGDLYLGVDNDNTGLRAKSTSQDWTIGFDGNNVRLKANDGTQDRWVREYDATGGHDFRTYKTESTGNPIQLYRQSEPKQFTITYATVSNGSASGVGDADAGETVNVTTTPATGYATSGVEVTTSDSNYPELAATGSGNSWSFTLPNDLAAGSTITVTPLFDVAYDIVTVTQYIDNSGVTQTGTTGGTITVPASATEESIVEVGVNPATDYRLRSLTYEWNNGSPSDITAAKRFSMPHYTTTVTATFELIPYTISVVSDHGEVSGLPATATAGTTGITFSVTPEAGYTVTRVYGTWEEGEQSGTVAITDNGNGTYSFNMVGHNVTITVTYFAGDEYELLTATDLANGGLNANDTYLIVGGAAGSAPTPAGVMGKTFSSNKLDVVTLVEGTNYETSTATPPGVISSTSAMNVVKFESDGDGHWAIKTDAGYLYSNSSGSMAIDANTPHYATIAVDGDNNNRATIALVSGGYKLSYNSTLFRFYSSEQGATYIYKQHASNKVKTPTIAGAAGKAGTAHGRPSEDLGLYKFIGTDEVTLACATTGATIYYTTDGSDPSDDTNANRHEYSEPFTITAAAADDEVVVKSYAVKDGMESSAVSPATFTCVRPTAPSFTEYAAEGTYYNPLFAYPKRALKDAYAYGEESITFYYTLDGNDPQITPSQQVTTKNSNGYYVYLDGDADGDAILEVITVINGIASTPTTMVYEFEVGAPALSLAGGDYTGDQYVRLSTATGTSLQNKSWTTKIYYTTTATAFAFDDATGNLTGAAATDWVEYDGGDIVLPMGHTTTLHAVTVTNYINDKVKFVASTETVATYTITAASLDVIFSPAGGTYVSAKHVTLTPQNAIGDVTILYDLTWANPDATHVNLSTEVYSGPITIDQDATLSILAEDERDSGLAGKTYEKSHTYKIGVQEPLYSPYPGDYAVTEGGTTTYYYGDHFTAKNEGDVTVEIFDVTPNSRIFYTFTKTATDDATYDGTVHYPEPDDPTTSSDLYSEPIDLEPGYTYVFKAKAFVGAKASTIRMRAFTVRSFTDRGWTASEYWDNIKEMNEETSRGSSSTAKKLANPVEVIYMSTHSNDGETPEYCFIRDNSGYGLVFFYTGGYTSSNIEIFHQGDWLAGNTVAGKVAVWSSSYINELGGSSASKCKVTSWPSTVMATRPIVPENATCKDIKDGWTYDGAYTGSDYAAYVDPDKNLFGHYIHLRKNKITDVVRIGSKMSGFITGELGTQLQYYDGLYLFSGHNGAPTYNQEFFDGIQDRGGTFAVYAIPFFYGDNTTKSQYSYAPYEVFPIAFEWIFPPIFRLSGDTSASDMTQDHIERDVHEAQTLTLSCETRGAQIWYKTSEMEDFVIYEGETIEIGKTTTIEAYSTHSTEHFDELISKVRSLTINIGAIEQPVISPASQVVAIGSTPVDATITCATEGATIWFTIDGSDPSDETNAARYEYTAENIAQYLTGIEETTTVRAIAEDDGFYSTEAEAKTYTFVKSNGIVYDLVTNANQLQEGYVYVIVNKANFMAMSAEQRTNNRGAAGVAFVDATKDQVYGNDEVAVFTLRKSGTSNWLMQTRNGATNAANGYLYVGNGNYLRTTEDIYAPQVANGNASATITIGADNTDVNKAYQATIHFLYEGDTDRYMGYWQRDNLFSCYTTQSNGPVFLYRKEATPLATIESLGEAAYDKTYIISDQLQCVYDDGAGHVWAKDQNNVSIARTEMLDGQIDYMKTVVTHPAEWDQSNWICLDFSQATGYTTGTETGLSGLLIKPAVLGGTITDAVNWTMAVPSLTDVVNHMTELQDPLTYVKNEYCPANFLTKNQTLSEASTNDFYLVNPKVQEVVHISFAVWDGEKFVVPAKSGDNVNGHDFDGAFNVGWEFNLYGNVASGLTVNDNYEFDAIVQRVTTGGGGSGAPRRAGKTGQEPDGTIKVMPTGLQSNATPTGVDRVNGAREVKAVRYVNVAGIASDRPWDGVNIVVTEYTDGSKSSRKMVR